MLMVSFDRREIIHRLHTDIYEWWCEKVEYMRKYKNNNLNTSPKWVFSFFFLFFFLLWYNGAVWTLTTNLNLLQFSTFFFLCFHVTAMYLRYNCKCIQMEKSEIVQNCKFYEFCNEMWKWGANEKLARLPRDAERYWDFFLMGRKFWN